MDRRAGGLILVALAIFATALVPNLRTKVIAGVPAAEPVSGPPAVGDCLLAPVVLEYFSMDGVLSFPRGSIGPCNGTHFGEVIEVKPDFPMIAWNPAEPFPGMTDERINELTRCFSSSSYLGLANIGKYGRVGGWDVAMLAKVGLVPPSVGQEAAGHRWRACVMLGAGSGTQDNSVPNAGSAQRLHQSIQLGSVPQTFGNRFGGPPAAARAVLWREPHTDQLLVVRI